MLPFEHRSQGKNRPYANDPFKKLSIQDALILVSVWAAVLDENNLQKKAKRIADLAQKEKLFEESDKVTLGRVHKCLNNMKHKKDQDSEIILASRSLPQKYRKLAFSWATDVMVMDGDATEDTLNPLHELYYKLGIEAKSAQDIIRKKLSSNPHH
jgi:hypothetical protein